jgi:hypothetical protein
MPINDTFQKIAATANLNQAEVFDLMSWLSIVKTSFPQQNPMVSGTQNDIRIVDENGVLRVILSGQSLLGEYGVDTNMAGFSPAGVMVWYMNPTTGILTGSTGDVHGPSSSTANHVAFFDGITGKLLKDGGITLSGSNTGDQTLAGLGGVAANGAISAGTKTKITYDSKGLVTGGANATTADIADSSNKRYVTDAQLAAIGTSVFVAPGTDVISTAVTAMGNGDSILLGKGTYTQTVNVAVPNTVTQFSIIGMGSGSTFINFTSDVDGITATGARVLRCNLSGFSISMNAASTAKTGIYILGNTPNAAVAPSVVLRDIVAIGDADAHRWGIHYKFDSAYNVVLDNCQARGRITGGVYTNKGVQFNSCVSCHVIGGYYHLLGTGFDLAKYSTDANGCEGITFSGTDVVWVTTGVSIGEKSLNIKFSDVNIDYCIYSAIEELATASGYHTISGGWFSFDTSADDYYHLIDFKLPGSTINGAILDGSNTAKATYGIVLEGNVYSIQGNTFRSHSTAIYMVSGGQSSIMGNVFETIASNDIYIAAGCNNNVVLGNRTSAGIVNLGSYNNVQAFITPTSVGGMKLFECSTGGAAVTTSLVTADITGVDSTVGVHVRVYLLTYDAGTYTVYDGYAYCKHTGPTFTIGSMDSFKAVTGSPSAPTMAWSGTGNSRVLQITNNQLYAQMIVEVHVLGRGTFFSLF